MKGMKYCPLKILLLLIFLKLFFKRPTAEKTPHILKQDVYRNFSTAQGKIDIEELNKRIFKKYGYVLIKNGLIPVLKKAVPMTCEKVFLSWQKVADNGLTINPPREIPNPTEFLLNNYSKLLYWYFNETSVNTKDDVRIWNRYYIDKMIKIAKKNPSKLPRSYVDESMAVHAATKDFNIKGQIGAVIGSQKPWAEVYILANGAKHVTTIDYHKITINHPQMDFLNALHLPNLRQKYYGKFDFIVSFSSIEHSGLGRYGDPKDPIGDIREMNKIHCMLKLSGLLFLAFPVGVDGIVYNAHRVYGRIRLAMMFKGFQLLKIYKAETAVSETHMENIFNDENHQSQYLFVLKKI